jgi:DNA-binding NarL/FixJ family response regulator
MTSMIPQDKIDQAIELFRRGRTYAEISADMDLPDSVIVPLLGSVGVFRDQLRVRRILVSQMARDGVPVEDIAEAVGLKTDTVKAQLNKVRIKYTTRTTKEKKS